MTAIQTSHTVASSSLDGCNPQMMSCIREWATYRSNTTDRVSHVCSCCHKHCASQWNPISWEITLCREMRYRESNDRDRYVNLPLHLGIFTCTFRELLPLCIQSTLIFVDDSARTLHGNICTLRPTGLWLSARLLHTWTLKLTSDYKVVTTYHWTVVVHGEGVLLVLQQWL